ncbi:hypothetical protein OPV22_029511 [Ensete ventricosum]|uniref:Uncharacterized protein n=1 Tax=Ensete ventricosum TaxID=4639 RepID=A0AAV8QDT5_ENSVE|nr:hypothetical protein OPV22_029511 [Ensete ventricosum]
MGLKDPNRIRFGGSTGSSDTRKANGCSCAHKRQVAHALGALHLTSSSSGKFAEGRCGRFQFKEARKSGRRKVPLEW